MSAPEPARGASARVPGRPTVARIVASCRTALGIASILVLQAAGAATRTDYLDLPFESLLQIEIPRVSGASGYEQSASEVPSAVTVITAAEIRRHGYRTLAEALSSERGFYVTDSQNYQFLGVRGFNQPGDYNSRILLLIDGMRLNDPVYGMAPIGQDFPLDVELIDRVEIIRGPGSSLYGSGGVLGVINVITKRGDSVAGTRFSGSAGSLGARGGSVSHGTRTEGGTDIVASMSGFRQDGQAPLVYPEFGQDPAMNYGVIANGSHEQARRLYLAVTHEDFRFSVIDGTRRRQFANGLYGTVFGDERGYSWDAWQFVDLQYGHELDAGRAIKARVYRGNYRYQADYPVDYPPVAINRDEVTSSWWGTDVRYDHPWNAHHLSVGAELVVTGHNQMQNFDLDPNGGHAGCIFAGQSDGCVDRRVHGGSSGVFVQDDIALSSTWRATGVLRHDWFRGVDSATSPRIGLIHMPNDDTTFKLIYGQSFRAPAHYERYSSYAAYSKDSPGLRSERARTIELIAEHSPMPNLRILASLFQYHVHALAATVTDPTDGLTYNTNQTGVRSRGAEVELQWRTGWLEARGSYARYDATVDDTLQRPASSPRSLAKLRLGVPLRDDRLYAGVEVQYASAALNYAGDSVPGATVGNLVLTSRGVVPKVDLSFGIYNVFDRRYGDPTSYSDMVGLQQHPTPGRTFRVKLDYLL